MVHINYNPLLGWWGDNRRYTIGNLRGRRQDQFNYANLKTINFDAIKTFCLIVLADFCDPWVALKTRFSFFLIILDHYTEECWYMGIFYGM